MKLVEVLAEELDEWADTTNYYAQDRTGCIYPWLDRPSMNGFEWKSRNPFGYLTQDLNPNATHLKTSLASDWDEALVTKEMWLAEKGVKGCDSTQTHTSGGGTSRHIHAESMKLYAEDVAETEKPWERWQGCLKGSECWEPMEQSPAWHTVCEYRRKPTTIIIGGEEVPEPEREPLDAGELYWVASTRRGDLAYCSWWYCDDIDMTRLRQGLVHRTEEAAVAHTKALIKVSGGEV